MIIIVLNIVTKTLDREFIFPFVCRFSAVHCFSKLKLTVNTNQCAGIIGIQVTFTFGTDFIAHHTSTVVTALNINVCCRSDYMPKERSYIIGDCNCFRIREIPQQRHSRTVFNRCERISIQ